MRAVGRRGILRLELSFVALRGKSLAWYTVETSPDVDADLRTPGIGE
jgi:hypothetical protein